MDSLHYREMTENLERLESAGVLRGKSLYLFGHCHAAEVLAQLLRKRGYTVSGILDNNTAKQGTYCEGIPILTPLTILSAGSDTAVLVAARAHASMKRQLRESGYAGPVEKLIEYNSFADYSLDEDTIQRMTRRLERGMRHLAQTKAAYPGYFRIYCPFAALGDVTFAMAYLPYFLERNKMEKYGVFVIGNACAQVARMYGVENVKVYSQAEMDEELQAIFYTDDETAFIAHHDRPYMVKLYKALYVKKIPLEKIYRCGVYGLAQDTVPYRPTCLKKWEYLYDIPDGRAVILSPHAKSVTRIPASVWDVIVRYFKDKGYLIFTNTSGKDTALPGTIRLSAKLNRMQSIVERAGTFIGLRSGLCDVLRWADCRKIALYPDCFYSDTGWKMEEIYHLDGWENYVVRDGSSRR